MSKKDIKIFSEVLMGFSLLSVVLAGIGYFVGDLWLASTQWLLVSAVLALFGIYLKEK